MRTLLVLARVSNLPTVWSNCLAAWLLAGGGGWIRFALLCLGASFLYTGGMFLNDAFDQAFDLRYRPERPLVAGLIRSRTVWMLSILWLGAGEIILCCLGNSAALFSSLLLLTIVLYDFLHKRTRLAPLLMAGCRFLLYLVAAAVADANSLSSLLPRAAVLAAYIIGLSYLARGESTGTSSVRWTICLVLAPALIAFLQASVVTWFIVGPVVIQVAWVGWCLWGLRYPGQKWLPRGVAGLLAGIALVDWLAAAGAGYAAAFLGCFVLALLLQRVAPAT